MERPASATAKTAIAVALHAFSGLAAAAPTPAPATTSVPALAPASATAAPARTPAPAAPVRPVTLAIIDLGSPAPETRAAIGEIYRTLAKDNRVRPEFRTEMRAALEEPAPPDPRLFAAEEALLRAREALNRLAYLPAIEEADLAQREALLARPSPVVAQLLAEVSVLAGVASHLRGAGEQAERRFRFALRLDPARVLDPVLYRADIRERFDRIRAEKTSHGRLLVRSSPPGATVLLDGRPAGTTPADGPGLFIEPVAAGEHLVSVELPGFFPRVFVQPVQPGLTSDIDTILSRADRAAHARDLVVLLRNAIAEGRGEEEGRWRSQLAGVLEADALVGIRSADGTAPDPDRRVAIVVYHGRNASALGERVLDLGRRSPKEIADDIFALLPAPAPIDRPPPIVIVKPPPPPPPLPVYRRWWFMAGLSGVLVAGTIASAIALSETHYRGVVEPFDVQ